MSRIRGNYRPPNDAPAWKRWRNENKWDTFARSELRVATRRLGLTLKPLFPHGKRRGHRFARLRQFAGSTLPPPRVARCINSPP